MYALTAIIDLPENKNKTIKNLSSQYKKKNPSQYLNETKLFSQNNSYVKRNSFVYIGTMI